MMQCLCLECMQILCQIRKTGGSTCEGFTWYLPFRLYVVHIVFGFGFATILYASLKKKSIVGTHYVLYAIRLNQTENTVLSERFIFSILADVNLWAPVYWWGRLHSALNFNNFNNRGGRDIFHLRFSLSVSPAVKSAMTSNPEGGSDGSSHQSSLLFAPWEGLTPPPSKPITTGLDKTTAPRLKGSQTKRTASLFVSCQRRASFLWHWPVADAEGHAVMFSIPVWAAQ